MTEKYWWWISFAVTFVFACLVTIQWHVANNIYQPNQGQLVDKSSTQNFITKLEEDYPKIAKNTRILTGVFIQSLEFKDANDVNLTGYVWQTCNKKKDCIPPGIVFPEVVESGSNIIPRREKEEYKKNLGERDVVGWYFEVTLRQKFEYKKYPLDHKTVWIRMWPKNFLENLLLVPDFLAYDSTQQEDAFGFDKDIVLGSWKIEETFFDYHLPKYDTNFGITSGTNPKSMPELYFNIVLKRKFINAFIINLVPLLTVAALLFMILMSVTTEREKAEKFGFSILGVIGVNSALFFVVIIAHIQLRSQFLGSSLIYIEYFYLLMYLYILAITLNSYLVSTGYHFRFIKYRDNLIPQLLYWPVLFGAGAIITRMVLF